MGQHADDIINGDVCQHCSEWLGGGEGYPRTCGACKPPIDTKGNEWAERRDEVKKARTLRANKFRDDVLPEIVKIVDHVADHGTRLVFTFKGASFTYYPKSDKIQLHKPNRWIKDGRKWLERRIIEKYRNQ